MQRQDAGLVTAGLRVGRRPAHHLCPVGSQPFDVLWMLISVGKRMVELGIGQAACVMSPRQREKGRFPAREFVQGRTHALE
jgi:hypothetical protein